MTPTPSAGAVLFVSDVRRVTTFYQSVAAMTLLHADDDHAVLEVAGFQLTVHAMRWSEPPAELVDGRAPVREDSYLKLCFPVASLAAARDTAIALGGWLQPPDREWEAREFRACDGADPEGNVIQLREATAT